MLNLSPFEAFDEAAPADDMARSSGADARVRFQGSPGGEEVADPRAGDAG